MANPKIHTQPLVRRRASRTKPVGDQAALIVLGEIAEHLNQLNIKLASANARLQIIERNIGLLSSFGISGGFRT